MPHTHTATPSGSHQQDEEAYTTLNRVTLSDGRHNRTWTSEEAGGLCQLVVPKCSMEVKCGVGWSIGVLGHVDL